MINLLTENVNSDEDSGSQVGSYRQDDGEQELEDLMQIKEEKVDDHDHDQLECMKEI